MKMDFIFIAGRAGCSQQRQRLLPLLVLAGALAACGRTAAPPPAPPPDGGDAQRLVALVDYIGGDYGGAVRNGQVVDRAEYDEQRKFAADILGLGRDLKADEPLASALSHLARLVREQAEPDAVLAAARAARGAAVARFGLETTPVERPSLQRAEALYAQSCAVCHGATGHADT